MNRYMTYLLTVILTEGLGFAVGMMTRNATQIYGDVIVKPRFSPPAILFPIAWTLLYALMAIGLSRVLTAEASNYRSAAVALYVGQLILNLSWCFIFFSFQRFDLAFLWLLLLFAMVVAMVVAFRQIDNIAWKLQIPYMLWLMFAGYLNAGVWMLNRA